MDDGTFLAKNCLKPTTESMNESFEIGAIREGHLRGRADQGFFELNFEFNKRNLKAVAQWLDRRNANRITGLEERLEAAGVIEKIESAG